jgi:hypothetical protein
MNHGGVPEGSRVQQNLHEGHWLLLGFFSRPDGLKDVLNRRVHIRSISMTEIPKMTVCAPLTSAKSAQGCLREALSSTAESPTLGQSRALHFGH